MGVFIGSNVISLAGSDLTVNTGVPMKMLSTGPVVRPNQCLFIAGGSSAGWVNLGNGWNTITTFTTVKVNAAGCYDAANSRFTAPVDGMYFFQTCAAHMLKDGAHVSYYWHPVFAVNGNVGGRVVWAAGNKPNYRLRGHGVSIASYEDASIHQIYKLSAGDYVESNIYSNGSPLNRQHVPYQQWSGFLLG